MCLKEFIFSPHKPTTVRNQLANPMSKHVLYFDGCSKGNPGRAGAGAVLYEVIKGEDGAKDKLEHVDELARLVGENDTNNLQHGAKTLEVIGDSKLVLGQIFLQWKVNKPHLQILKERAHALISRLGEKNVTQKWVPRAENSVADKLSNKALENK
jgi:ribonuclease HI